MNNEDGRSFVRLVEIMAQLRAEDGFPWDREQTHATLKPYLLEEAYEALEAIDIRGSDGHTLREKWDDESKSIMGVYAAGYPNFFMITGPQAPFANLPTSIEQNVAYITDCIQKMESEGYDLFQPSPEAEDEWSAHTAEIHEQTLMAQGCLLYTSPSPRDCQ